MLEISQLADVLAELHLSKLVIVITCHREALQVLQVLHLLRKSLARLEIQHAELHAAHTSHSLRVLLHEGIGSLPEGYAAPVAHVVACIVSSHAVELLIDHDDREGISGTGILNLRSRSLANGKDHIIRLVAVSIHKLIFCIHRNEMNLSHTHSRNDVHIPAELELHAARTRLAVEHDTQVGTGQLILVLGVQEPSFTLTFVLHLLGIRHIALEGILDASDLAFHIGRNQTFESTLIV